jgi:hypothetical protein
MGEPPSQHMNKFQKTYVRAVLHQAFADGTSFDDVDQVEAFFKKNNVPVDFNLYSRDLFNIFLEVKAESRQPLTPVEESHLGTAGTTFDPNDDAEPDCDADASPIFTNEVSRTTMSWLTDLAPSADDIVGPLLYQYLRLTSRCLQSREHSAMPGKREFYIQDDRGAIWTRGPGSENTT